jgi:hypothetical protein
MKICILSLYCKKFCRKIKYKLRTFQGHLFPTGDLVEIVDFHKGSPEGFYNLLPYQDDGKIIALALQEDRDNYKTGVSQVNPLTNKVILSRFFPV